VSGASVQHALVAFIQARSGHWDENGMVGRDCLLAARSDHLLARLASERGRLTAIEEDVARTAARHLTLATDLEAEFQRTATFGDRAADSVARLGGSWSFVIAFTCVLVGWIAWNGHRGEEAFDPFPFILLNLVLSSIAAFQAPIIMMAQNRVAERDRRQADQDFKTNLKSEIEVAAVHEKLDHLIHVQWEELIELQELQLELLQELRQTTRGSVAPPPPPALPLDPPAATDTPRPAT